MCSVHVEFECDGEFPECYEIDVPASVDNAMEAEYPEAF